MFTRILLIRLLLIFFVGFMLTESGVVAQPDKHFPSAVSSVSIFPDTLYGELNLTIMCFTATVKDDAGDPVIGITVDFYIDGMGPVHKSSVTDTAGKAICCYGRNGTTEGIDSIYAKVLDITSENSWGKWKTCLDPEGGKIGYSQIGCGIYTPDSIVSLFSPAGYEGNVEFIWQVSITDSLSEFTDIPGTNSAGYSPGSVSQTTWYRRLCRSQCSTGWISAGVSNVVEMKVTVPVMPSVTLSFTPEHFCNGTPVTITADASNGGINPAYQWIVNGINAGSDTSGFTYTPSDFDSIRCILTSDLSCVQTNPVSSQKLILVSDSALYASITITPSVNPFCEGAQVTMTALAVNGGNNPVYQWIVNGNNAGSGLSTYTYTPHDNDSIRCVLVSDLDCIEENPVSSLKLILHASVKDTAMVSIVASVNPFCEGTEVTLTASPVNGGTDPSFQWMVNGTVSGPDSSVYSFTPSMNDVISCKMISNLECIAGSPAISSPVTMIQDSSVAKFSVTPVDTVISYPVITFTDQSTGAISCVIEWGDGTVTDCNADQHQYAAAGTYRIREIIGSVNGCTDTAFATVLIRPEISMYIPGAFSPNGDGVNDIFKPTFKGVSDYSMEIYSRFGEKVFSSDDPATGWDGSAKNHLCPNGTYVYRISFSDNEGLRKLIKGSIEIIR